MVTIVSKETWKKIGLFRDLKKVLLYNVDFEFPSKQTYVKSNINI